MTVSSTTLKNSYSGNGSTTAFAYNFKVFASSELKVFIRASTGAETLRSAGTGSTNYAVTGVGAASGGTVTFVTAPASGETVVLLRDTGLTQNTDYLENDSFPANSHEEALDRLTHIVQELDEEVQRSFKVSKTNSITTPEFVDDAATRASKLLGFDSDGDLEATTGRVSSVSVSNVATSGGSPGTATASFTTSTGALALGIPVGQTGMMGGVSMQYSTTTTDSDPGAGFIRLNNASLNSATIMYVDDSDGTTDISAWVQSWDDATSGSTKGYITIAGNPNPASPMVIFKVTGAVTDASGYTKVPVSYVAGSTSMSNNAEISIAFSPSGDSDYAGLDYTFSTTTADADPGTGVIRLNNGTLGSVTAIYIDDADANSADVSAYILSWDDSTNTADRGQVRVTKKSAPANYAIYKLSGTSTDASGYVKLAVTHVDSNGSFADSDAVAIEFTRSGNAGSLSDPMTTRGDVIVRDSSNATARLAVGSANTVLQSDGTDVSYGTVATAMIANNAVDETKLKDALVADFTEVTVAAGDSILLGDVSDSGNTKRDTVQGILDLAGGGGYEFVSTTTASSSASIAFESLSGDFDYLFILKSLNNSADAHLDVQFATGSTSYVTANYQFQTIRAVQSSAAYLGNDGSGQSTLRISQATSGAGAGEYFDGRVEVFNLANSSHNTSLFGMYACEDSSGTEGLTIAGGRLEDSATNTAIKFFPSTGNFTDGSISMFKRANA